MIHTQTRPFGTCALGAIDCITLGNSHGMSVELLTVGASIRSITVPDKNGNPTDVVLGYDHPQQYLDCASYTGGCIGRYANRIGGASFQLDGQTISLTANQDNVHHIHGGRVGYNHRLWKYQPSQEGSAVFTLTDLHMDEGYPGDVTVTVTFTLDDNNCLTVDYQAQSDRNTIMNMTHHPYFNLDGHNAGSVESHSLQINGSFYTPTNDAGIPNGEIRHVAGTALDFRSACRVSDAIHHPSLARTRGLDHTFVLGENHGQTMAKMTGATSGITLSIATTLPSIQAYTAGFFGDQIGKNGASYHNHSSLALEPQFPPNSINYPHFPSPILKAGDLYHHTIAYQFGIVK